MSLFEPSDWKSTRVPKLMQLDSLQRCLICKDFLRAPVMTSCNHTFCSQCVRQHLMTNSLCPLCKTEQFESNLKRNILLEEIVSCYQGLRQDLISSLRAEQTPEAQSHTPTHGTPSHNRSEDLEIIEVRELKPNRTPEPGSALCPVCNEEMNSDYLQRNHLDLCLNGKKDPKLVKMKERLLPAKRKRADVSLFFSRQKRAAAASAEVNHEEFYFNEAHKHHQESKRIPKIDFSSLATSKVKEKLAALKLPTHGTRPQLEMRYNQYYLLQHSNLDSNRPQTDLELRQRLNQWEKSHLAFLVSGGGNAIFGDSLLLKPLTDKDFPVGLWLERYKDEFRELIKVAKKNRKVATNTSSLLTEAQSSGPEGEAKTSGQIGEAPTDDKLSHEQKDESNNLSTADVAAGPNSEEACNIRSTPEKLADESALFEFSKSTLFMPDTRAK